ALTNAVHAARMPQLLPALADKAYTVAHQGESKVGDKDAVGVTVAHKGRADVSVQFDKETGLPLKSQARITGPNNEEKTVEFLYGDYKEVNGVKHPMKVTLKTDDDEIVLELSEVTPKDKVEDSEFAKP